MEAISEYSPLVNFICNIILFIAFTCFFIFVFGRKESLVYKFSISGTWLLKFGLCFCTVGALYNVVSFSDPPISEIILNIGLAALFTWAAWFHYARFVKSPSNNKRQITNKRKTASRKKK